MDYRTLEINLQYARDLNNVNLISKMDVYAVVSIAGGDKSSKQKTKTPVDREGNTNPTWNFPMKFTVDEAALQMNRLTLDFQLICERALGDKDIGEVHVPIKELLDTPPMSAGADGKQFVSYQVRKPSGRPKGQLFFNYQFGGKNVGAAEAATTYGSPILFSTPPGKGDAEPVMAYPPGPSSSYDPPYPPPPEYPPMEGKDNYPPPGLYPPADGGVPPPGGYPPPSSGYGYPPPPSSGYGYPPPPSSGYGYPPPPPGSGYGYPPPPPGSGYGYPPPPQPGYGYPPQAGYGYPQPPPVQKPAKKNKFGMGLGAGLLGGAVGGLLVGDMISDAGDFDGGFDF